MESEERVRRPGVVAPLQDIREDTYGTSARAPDSVVSSVERDLTRWGFRPVTGQRASCYDRPLDLGSGPRTGPTGRHMVLRQSTNRTIHGRHGEASNPVNIHFYNDLPLRTPGAIWPPNGECNLLLRPIALPGGLRG